MSTVERIGVDQAQRKVAAGKALLICAYEDEAKCRANALPGSMSLAELESRTASLSKSQELIFYCA